MDSIITILLTLTLLALIVLVRDLLRERSAESITVDSEQSVEHLLSRAERRIERLMADAKGAMLDEALSVDEAEKRPPRTEGPRSA